MSKGRGLLPLQNCGQAVVVLPLLVRREVEVTHDPIVLATGIDRFFLNDFCSHMFKESWPRAAVKYLVLVLLFPLPFRTGSAWHLSDCIASNTDFTVNYN
jgi:hypothetical protein